MGWTRVSRGRERRPRPRSILVMCGKVTYPNEHDATVAMHDMIISRPHGRKDRGANVYFCPRCNGWHWGRLPLSHPLVRELNGET